MSLLFNNVKSNWDSQFSFSKINIYNRLTSIALVDKKKLYKDVCIFDKKFPS